MDIDEKRGHGIFRVIPNRNVERPKRHVKIKKKKQKKES